jgi:hypothetical protein
MGFLRNPMMFWPMQWAFYECSGLLAVGLDMMPVEPLAFLPTHIGQGQSHTTTEDWLRLELRTTSNSDPQLPHGAGIRIRGLTQTTDA